MYKQKSSIFVQSLFMQPKLLLNAHQIDILLHRLACQLIENHRDFSNAVLIGLQPRGVYLLDRLTQRLV